MTYCHHKRHIERKSADLSEKNQTMEYHNNGFTTGFIIGIFQPSGYGGTFRQK